MDNNIPDTKLRTHCSTGLRDYLKEGNTSDIPQLDFEIDAAADVLCDALARQNDFADNIEALQNTTPRAWAGEVARAQHRLRERVTALYEEMNEKLHGGEFAK